MENIHKSIADYTRKSHVRRLPIINRHYSLSMNNAKLNITLSG